MPCMGGVELDADAERVTTAPTPEQTVDDAAPSWRSLAVVAGVAVVFLGVALLRSQDLGIGMRDPGGQMFWVRLLKALEMFAILAVVDLAWRTWRGRAAGVGTALVANVRSRLAVSRLALILLAEVAYHVVYASYRNLKSWLAFDTPQDNHLLSLDRWLFFGHDPAALLHSLLGTGVAAVVLVAVYRAFTYVTAFSLQASLAFVTRLRDSYVFVTAGMWAWILAIVSYYAIPTLGPFASSPQTFASLPDSVITRTQDKYLLQRTEFLANPYDHSTFVSIAAFASLHVGFTCLVMLMARYYGRRVLTILLGVYLAAVMVSTVYLGWHFVVDVVAGLVLGALAVAIGHVTIYGLHRRTPGRRLL